MRCSVQRAPLRARAARDDVATGLGERADPCLAFDPAQRRLGSEQARGFELRRKMPELDHRATTR
jgi:hypothetical protein